MTTTINVTEELEALIDSHGLLHVLTGLTCVLGEKADHIRANWQDEGLAKAWDKASRVIDKASVSIAPLNI